MNQEPKVIPVELTNETFERAPLPRKIKGHKMNEKVTLRCNECGKKRKVSPNGNFNDRCPKCGGVDWDVL
ncbi:MAG: hypothetical protein JO356_08690 [Acidobacteria bacterium]|nr:hypothetical protein [Acidobacteriota bacterium]